MEAKTSADLYETIHRRRDVRGEFTGEAVPGEMLDRILGAAHAAPSVGLSQPWDFVVISDRRTRELIWSHVQAERQAFACGLDDDRAERFARIRIDGVLESS